MKRIVIGDPHGRWGLVKQIYDKEQPDEVIILGDYRNKSIYKCKSEEILPKYSEIMKEIRESKQLKLFWEKYQKEFSYAKQISFGEICELIYEVVEKIMN